MYGAATKTKLHSAYSPSMGPSSKDCSPESNWATCLIWWLCMDSLQGRPQQGCSHLKFLLGIRRVSRGIREALHHRLCGIAIQALHLSDRSVPTVTTLQLMQGGEPLHGDEMRLVML